MFTSCEIVNSIMLRQCNYKLFFCWTKVVDSVLMSCSLSCRRLLALRLIKWALKRIHQTSHVYQLEEFTSIPLIK